MQFLELSRIGDGKTIVVNTRLIQFFEKLPGGTRLWINDYPAPWEVNEDYEELRELLCG